MLIYHSQVVNIVKSLIKAKLNKNHFNLICVVSKVHVKKTNASPTYLKISHFDTLKKQGWEETNKVAVRSVLRS